jgi:hypothetical protein
MTDQTEKYQDKYLTETMNLFVNFEIINKSSTQQIKVVISETKHSQSQTYPNTKTNQNNKCQPDKQVLNQVHKQNRHVTEQHSIRKSQHNNIMTIIVNNIAGFSPNTCKMQDIMQWIETKNCDIFLGQEANISFKHQAISYLMDTQWTPKYHLISAELHWKFNTLKNPAEHLSSRTKSTDTKLAKSLKTKREDGQETFMHSKTKLH